MRDHVGKLLGTTAKHARTHFERGLAEADATFAEWLLLRQADSAGPPPSQQHLAELMDIGGPALVRHIDRLEELGLVTRTRDEGDRRVVRIALTPAGRRRLRTLSRIADRYDDELRALLSGPELNTFTKVLQRIDGWATDADHSEET